VANQERAKVVIIGGGFGGLSLARHLGALSVDVTLIDRQNHHLFQPLLYQVATASLSPADIAVPIRSVLSGYSNVSVIMGEVMGVDFVNRQVRSRIGKLFPYDFLVIAAGTKTNYFGNDSWAEHAIGLKSLSDAIRIREQILKKFEAAEREEDAEKRAKMLSFVVIGGGPTGVEMAGAISELSRQTLSSDYRRIHPEDIRVTLVEMAPRLLTAFDEKLSTSALHQLTDLGVDVRTGVSVKNVTADSVTVDSEVITTSVVVWAAGVRPVSLSSQLGLASERGALVVQNDCSIPGYPNVFAIGDIAHFLPEGEARPLPGVAPVAIQQARHVAKMIKRTLNGGTRSAFRYRDKGTMATIGRSRAVAQSGHLRLTGTLAWLAWLFIHVLYLIGFRNRVIVMFNWFWSYLTFKRGARLITQRW